MSTSLKDSVHSLIDHIKQGKILEAMEAFYDSHVSMRENKKDPTVGLAPNIEREKQFLAQVRDFHGFDATAVGVDETAPGTGKVLMEAWLEFTNTQGDRVKLEQVSVQEWKDGKIVSERFYYDSAG